MMDSNPLPECPDSPNCERTQIIIETYPDDITQTISDVLVSMNAHEINVENENRISAVFRIPVFGWKDDVDILIEDDEQNGRQVIYLRSASRTGYSDLGVNKRRLARFIRMISREVTVAS